MTAPWFDDPRFPMPLLDLLLAGTVGRDHLLRAAALAGETAVGADAPGLWRRRQAHLLVAALEEDSLYGPTAAVLAGLFPILPAGCVAPAFAALVTALAARFTVPDNTAYYQRLLLGDNAGRLDRYLENEIQTDRHALFWLHVALRRAVLQRDFDRAATLAGSALTGTLAPLRHKIDGDLALLGGRPAQAMGHYAALQAKAPWPGGLFRQGLAALAAGDAPAAQDHLAGLARAVPEHVSAMLALADLVSGRGEARSLLPGSLSVALYTYNKADDLNRTLESLLVSDLATSSGPGRVYVLDNASVDATPDVVAAWTGRIDPGRLTGIRLPVNIGAPAARNWLAADARVREADYVAYLDDDVDLPRDWLARLAAAAKAYPEAGVWGCHVADAHNPAIAQGIDGMLLPLPSGSNEPLILSDLHAQGFDYGGFAHLRPCLTVMGCCHLFRRDRLLGVGGFDIRYSPSQYDDVDHDLRLLLAGLPPVYQGHLTIGHRRPSPALAPVRPEQLAGGQANWQKLVAKHDSRYAAMATLQRDAATRDLRRKVQELAEAGIVGK
ncbi:glycosyltransferase family 2 protein [Desulfovibrio sp. TomC]|uniref:glycosyltransferase family 2 protein n=1 Tax=Desulfovibrio sp. TomC TaxID=1562888 RepID=UPI0005743A55|nr:glycosyltransferase [Desulfovibrio sp. TomC]KHK04485.1 Glycosyl transferase, group 2 family protein [Desulfovibrio sp. TomC]